MRPNEHNFIVADATITEELRTFCAREILLDENATVVESPDMLAILVQCDLFPSKGQARKNWKGPTEAPHGFSTFTVGKHRTVVNIHRIIPE
jgi:hypothetical protein